MEMAHKNYISLSSLVIQKFVLIVILIINCTANLIIIKTVLCHFDKY